MFYYVVRKDNFYQYIVETIDDIQKSNLIKITKLYQVIEIIGKGKFLIKLFMHDDSSTFIIPEMNGTGYYFNTSEYSDIMNLREIPKSYK